MMVPSEPNGGHTDDDKYQHAGDRPCEGELPSLRLRAGGDGSIQPRSVADAEAIAAASLRPTMRFVAVKSAETQRRAVAFRTHQCLVRQRTQLINALGGHLAELGLVAVCLQRQWDILG